MNFVSCASVSQATDLVLTLVRCSEAPFAGDWVCEQIVATFGSQKLPELIITPVHVPAKSKIFLAGHMANRPGGLTLV